MSCPTCDHTMHFAGKTGHPTPDRPVFWCPRCGSVVTGAEKTLMVPMLVGRCREFGFRLRHCPDADAEAMIASLRKLWVMSGIDESTYLPKERPEAPNVSAR